MKHTADQILQVAIELERRGRTFYKSLAAGCGDAEIAALADTLAKAETEHMATFKRMRDALPENLRMPKMNGKKLMAATDELRRKIMPDAKLVRKAVVTSDLGKTLDIAIEMENEAVAFYTGLASGVADPDAAVLLEIVDEERGHLNMLHEVRKLFALCGTHGI